MKTKNLKERKTIDEEIERVLKQMETMYAGTDEYKLIAENLKLLYEAKGVKSHKSISSDTVINAVVTIASILLILNYENMHVLTSKGLAFVPKNRG